MLFMLYLFDFGCNIAVIPPTDFSIGEITGHAHDLDHCQNMLSRRIITGITIVIALLGLCWSDMYLSAFKELPRGLVMFPLFMVCLFVFCEEVLKLLNAGGLYPHRFFVHIANFVLATSCWGGCLYQQYRENILGEDVPLHGWEWVASASFFTLLGMAAAILICFGAEMLRFVRPGGVIINLAGAIFTVTYVGLLACFLIQLRMAFGITALLSLITVAKMGDTGAYTIGRIFGTHKMAPGLSPKKTIEGAVGGIVFACLGAMIWFEIIIPFSADRGLLTGGFNPPNATVFGWVSFGIAIAISGLIGDLAGSLIKRDVGVKDSGSRIPGFGGFLDLFDSLMMAAPVAFAFWAFGAFGRN